MSDSPLPTIGDSPEDPSHGEPRGKLISWLEDPPHCPGRDDEGCGVMMKADTVFHPVEAAYVHAWTCPECELSIERDPVHDQEPGGPREVSGLLGSLFG